MYRTFPDRREAGRQLGREVVAYLREVGARGRPLVLALPRGGLPVGLEVATAVGGDLDITVARKIGLPGQPEYGIGAVTADGPPIFTTSVLRRLGLRQEDLMPTVDRERAEAWRRLRRYRGDRPPPEVGGRTVIVTDDGLATGVTATAALRQLRARGPELLVFAAPVCAPDAAQRLGSDVDAVVYVLAPRDFTAVGAWYDDFRQLTDRDVIATLAEAHPVS